MGEMYTERLLDHYRRPRNKGHLEQPDSLSEEGQVLAAREYNPLCGDQVTVEALVEDGRIVEVLEELASFGQDEYLEELGSTVRPARLKCALLPWMAFRHAAFGEDEWSLVDQNGGTV